ncbi:hypothetical protein GCM10010347_43660 [Streptomyces cirratus]|uniref:Transposase IS4-like domain-containing protein n=1 Tax=Streptomyces cirratus TaxID=68187 RepID=A0ABQ3EWH2_9ACTN|nr:hypothetical protein GCM10010347_43660 [Streptomyces cirratus]
MPRKGVGRPRTRAAHVLADKAYTSRKNRRYLRRRGIPHTIPERLDQQRHRRNRGSRGGRPTGFDREQYKKRNTVERAINRLKGRVDVLCAGWGTHGAQAPGCVRQGCGQLG